ncbi:hypothetical protein [Novosphingobium sp. EMRT-2]|uniref:hypothetical protein n=1 Tax=Novosphingobium sp. EMRT-2 TaxID=2571749 RepID=UPI0010BE19AE|nr:hypothetical protein [Novosphingobium sp. EMRT-2]QCI92127.1 hypothetical protein FA702_00105 [Novosphingobium sp. EMRT-2]QCI95165.1 hypothetical protein FA702_17730 [Novosphingobium sp. EMRT-2]
MTYPTEVTMPFADGSYRFFLPQRQVSEFEEKHGTICGLEFNLRSCIMMNGEGHAIFSGGGAAEAQQIRDLIRAALIGGNKAVVDDKTIEVGPQAALALVDRYVYPARPLGESAALAWRILGAAIYGNQLGEVAANTAAADPQKAGQADE